MQSYHCWAVTRVMAGSLYLLTACKPVPAPTSSQQESPAAEKAVQAAHPSSALASQLTAHAQLLRVSASPDPAKAPYADCAVVAEFLPLSIAPEGARLPRRFLVAMPVFLARKPQPIAKAKLGRVWKLQLPAEPDVKEGPMKIMQLVDDIQDLELPQYYTMLAEEDPRAASEFPPLDEAAYLPTQDAPAPASGPSQPVRYPWSAKAAEARRAAIAADKARIEAVLASHGGDWQRWAKELEPFHDELGKKLKASKDRVLQNGQNVFEIDRAEKFEELTKNPAKGPLKMLQSLSAQLRARGTDLIVVPFPYKEFCIAHHFSDKAPADGYHAPWWTKFIHELLASDVEVIDLQPLLQANDPKHEYVFYDARDQHPADGGIQIAAAAIAERLKRYDLKNRPEFVERGFKLVRNTFTTSETNPTRGLPPGKRYPATQVLDASGKGVEIGEMNPCPVIVMGDSFTVVPGLEPPSATLPCHLAYHLGEAPAQLLRMGSSNQAMQMLAREGGKTLKNRVAMVFIFGPTRLMGAVSATADGGWDLYDLPPLPLGN